MCQLTIYIGFVQGFVEEIGENVSCPQLLIEADFFEQGLEPGLRPDKINAGKYF